VVILSFIHRGRTNNDKQRTQTVTTQTTLCDPIWQVTLRNSVRGSIF